MQWSPQNNSAAAIAWNDTVELLDPSVGFDRYITSFLYFEDMIRSNENALSISICIISFDLQNHMYVRKSQSHGNRD